MFDCFFVAFDRSVHIEHSVISVSFTPSRALIHTKVDIQTDQYLVRSTYVTCCNSPATHWRLQAFTPTPQQDNTSKSILFFVFHVQICYNRWLLVFVCVCFGPINCNYQRRMMTSAAGFQIFSPNCNSNAAHAMKNAYFRRCAPVSMQACMRACIRLYNAKSMILIGFLVCFSYKMVIIVPLNHDSCNLRSHIA